MFCVSLCFERYCTTVPIQRHILWCKNTIYLRVALSSSSAFFGFYSQFTSTDCFSCCLFSTFTSPTCALCCVAHNDGQLHAATTTVSWDVFVASQPANAGHSSLSRRLSDFYEYMYTAQSGGGFVFISLGDTSAAAPLHLFHLRRLRLALQVRSHHASMLPRHHGAAERAQALPLLHPSFSTGNFHQFLVFCVFLFPQCPRSSAPLILPRQCVLLWGWDGCKHCSRKSSGPHTVSEQVRLWTGGVRQVLDEASAHECNCQNVCVPPSVMTC